MTLEYGSHMIQGLINVIFISLFFLHRSMIVDLQDKIKEIEEKHNESEG